MRPAPDFHFSGHLSTKFPLSFKSDDQFFSTCSSIFLMPELTSFTRFSGYFIELIHKEINYAFLDAQVCRERMYLSFFAWGNLICCIYSKSSLSIT